jgi:hypothetical protein
MAVTNFTSLLGLALPTTGDLSGTWGTAVNDQITQLIDSAVAGTTTLTTDGNVTLSTTNGASNQARQAVIVLTGARTAVWSVTAPAQSKAYVVINATTGGFAVTVRGSGPTTGVSVANGERCLVAWNGSDFIKVGSSLITALTGVLTVSNGGTGVSTLTGIAKGSGTSAFTAAVAGTDYLAPPSGTAILKANSGGALANATAGTDYVAPGTATTFTALQTFNGSAANLAATFNSSLETLTVAASPATGTVNLDALTQPILYYTTASTGNWSLNVRGSSSVTLNSLMSNGQSITVVFMATNGATPYYQSGLLVDGSSVTPKWLGGTAPVAGNASSIDVYSITLVKTASATFTALATQSKFA